jgi:predicted nucleic acid-binding protein
MDLTILDTGVLIAILNSDDAHHERAGRLFRPPAIEGTG